MLQEKTKPQYYYKPDKEGGFGIYSIVFAIGSKRGLNFENWVDFVKTEDEAICKIKTLSNL